MGAALRKSTQEERDSYDLHAELSQAYPSFLQDLERWGYSEYDPWFMGFVTQYKALAAIIPRQRTVYDFGCYSGAQVWYFRDHAGYVGIEPSEAPKLHLPNATYRHMSAQEYLKATEGKGPWYGSQRAGFAILNYVPDNEAATMVKAAFRDVFCFYPHLDDHDPPTLKLTK